MVWLADGFPSPVVETRYIIEGDYKGMSERVSSFVNYI